MSYEEQLKLFSDNTGLVHYVIHKSWFNSCSFRDDLEQEGMKILWESVLRYDESKGASFASYAVRRLYCCLFRYANVVRYGHMGSNFNFTRGVAAAADAFQAGMPLEEICSRQGLSRIQAQYAFLAAHLQNNLLSLNRCVNESIDEPLENIIADTSVRSHEDIAMEDFLMKALYCDFVDWAGTVYVGKYSYVYEELIHMYLDNIFKKKRSYAVIADKLGIPCSTVRTQFARIKRLLKEYILQNPHLLSEPISS